MGDENIDDWWWRMESHRIKGHQVIKSELMKGFLVSEG